MISTTLTIGSIVYLATTALGQFSAANTITRDIVILGGGATGTYASVMLGDLDQSVVLIEKNDYLGGHTNTYYVPVTNTPVDFGVLFYHNDSITRDFYARLGVPLAGPAAGPVLSGLHADFSRSVIFNNYSAPAIGPDYTNELAKYPYLANGITLPDPVPTDLLLPWSEYLSKFNIVSSAQASFNGPSPAGQPLERLALYEFNFLNNVVLEEEAGDLVANANHDNSEIFRMAQADIGAANVLLNSTVVSGTRASGGVQLVVSTPTGQKLIVAKQLIVAAPPQASNLASIGLDSRESGVLSQVGGYPFYAGVVNNTGLPAGFSYNNADGSAEFFVPSLPAMLLLTPAPTAPGLFTYTYSSLTPMTQAQVQAAAASSIKNLQVTMKSNGSNTNATPNFVAFADHSPFHLEQSATDIANGFYSQMAALQGYRNTWYIGALTVLSSSQLWNNTALLLPDIVAAAKATS